MVKNNLARRQIIGKKSVSYILIFAKQKENLKKNTEKKRNRFFKILRKKVCRKIINFKSVSL